MCGTDLRKSPLLPMALWKFSFHFVISVILQMIFGVYDILEQMLLLIMFLPFDALENDERKTPSC